MYISKIQVLNYKSFWDSGELEFSPGINIIVGQNNAGKTALLEAISLKFSELPHRSIKTLPNPSSKLELRSEIILTLTIEKEKFHSLVNEMNPLFIPAPEDGNFGTKALALFVNWLSQPDPVELSITIPSNDLPISSANNRLNEVKFGYKPVPPDSNGQYIGIRSALANISYKEDTCELSRYLIGEHFIYQIFSLFKPTIYRFRAERLNISSCSPGCQDILQPNASNLAEVLSVLFLKNPTRSDRFNELVSTIFPEIQRVSIEPKHNQQLEIKIWHIDPATEREDLSFPLSECGTGISQVLAILYVVITSIEPRTIIIDEPQSFLHPGAAKKLIEILKQFPQHQYFIATHSPQIVTIANPSTIIQLRYENSETKTETINSLNTLQMRSLLSEVGVSLSDVFGADNILWVEGATEELCFPMILEKVTKQSLKGTQIIAVKNTGDLEAKNAATIFEIYRRLSGGNTLFPPAIGFLLDSEGKTKEQKDNLRKTANTLENYVEQHKQVQTKKGIPVEFLQRRMYENYLLHPKAIAAVLKIIFNEYEHLQNKTVTDVDIQEFFEKKRTDGDYLPKDNKNKAPSHTDWVTIVRGDKILEEVFRQFTDGLVAFNKTTYSPLITEWLVENEPEHLSELGKLLQGMLNYESKGK